MSRKSYVENQISLSVNYLTFVSSAGRVGKGIKEKDRKCIIYCNSGPPLNDSIISVKFISSSWHCN